MYVDGWSGIILSIRIFVLCDTCTFQLSDSTNSHHHWQSIIRSSFKYGTGMNLIYSIAWSLLERYYCNSSSWIMYTRGLCISFPLWCPLQLIGPVGLEWPEAVTCLHCCPCKDNCITRWVLYTCLVLWSTHSATAGFLSLDNIRICSSYRSFQSPTFTMWHNTSCRDVMQTQTLIHI